MWESIAALGWDVVPEVNWMLIVSEGARGASGMIGRAEGDEEDGEKPGKRVDIGIRERRVVRGGKRHSG